MYATMNIGAKDEQAATVFLRRRMDAGLQMGEGKGVLAASSDRGEQGQNSKVRCGISGRVYYCVLG